jgi:cobalt-zinc-cadmium efflux system outer membrane protein
MRLTNLACGSERRERSHFRNSARRYESMQAGTIRSTFLWGALMAACVPIGAQAQAPPSAQPQAPGVSVTLDQAIAMALQHNHALLAARTTIDQGRADETTANLRPNPALAGDTQFLPLFNPDNWTADYLTNTAQFDLGLSYLFERGGKRQARLQAARAATAVTTATVSENQRTLTFNVASQFIAALLAQSQEDFATQDLASFQQTLDVSQASFNAGALSESDLLKLKLQLLQFQTDVSSARLARLQALATLRQLLGYESVPQNYQVAGMLDYLPVTATEDALQMLAMRQRPDLQAAQLGVNAAQRQLSLEKANAKRDVTAQLSYSHVAATNSASIFGNIEVPLFDRNQGNIAKAGFAVTQSQELSSEQSSVVATDVANAYEGLRTSDQIVQLYQTGYLQQSQDSRDISTYAYQRGAVSILDFLDSERSYRATQLAYRQALANYMTAVEQLRQAVGGRNLP